MKKKVQQDSGIMIHVMMTLTCLGVVTDISSYLIYICKQVCKNLLFKTTIFFKEADVKKERLLHKDQFTRFVCFIISSCILILLC